SSGRGLTLYRDDGRAPGDAPSVTLNGETLSSHHPGNNRQVLDFRRRYLWICGANGEPDIHGDPGSRYNLRLQPGRNPVLALSVPEPTASVIFLLGSIFLIYRQRRSGGSSDSIRVGGDEGFGSFNDSKTFTAPVLLRRGCLRLSDGNFF
ncbi:MAG TPA: PEP-CTERM sorting domain-containing protein, partial [Verrucomicrobiae bacterium]|nr:PEP-CTERM sorting domain-containing protein [Verrucomicrobiae bacterium]